MNALRLFVTITMFIPFLCCNAQPTKKEVKESDDSYIKIEAFYFHFTFRCPTCRTIEAKTKENLETLYPNQMKKGLITFKSINLDEASSRSLADRFGISGVELLIVKGDQKIDLTNVGFLYAMDRPEKFKKIIKEKVDGLLID